MPNKNTLRDIEVLSDGAIVTEVVSESEKSTPFVMGDDVVVTESNKLKASLDLYINSKTMANGEEVKSDLTEQEINDLLNYIGNEIFDGVKSENRYGAINFKGYLKKGAKLKIISLASNIRGGRDNTKKGKYETIMFDFYYNNKLISRNKKVNDKNITHRFTIGFWDNEVYDYSKYLKKI